MWVRRVGPGAITAYIVKFSAQIIYLVYFVNLVKLFTLCT